MPLVAEQNIIANNVQFEIDLWLNEFQFYKNEIALFNQKLERIIGRKQDMIELSQLEHFQNQFIRQNEVIDELRHDVKQHENAVERIGDIANLSEEDECFQSHLDLDDQMTRFKKIYTELRYEFMDFLSH